MVALSAATLGELPRAIARPAYDRRKVVAGIAHLSVGNFHRAHQAAYVESCLADSGQAAWGICGIGVLDSEGERAKAAGFRRQDGLYGLSLFPARGEPSSRVIGAMVDYLHAPEDPAAAVARLADPAVRIVSMTITEGGYNLDEATGRFRLDAPGVVHDLANPQLPRTVFGLISSALERRRAAGAAAFTVLSCDNLRHNGEAIRKGILAFAGARDPGLAGWIERSVTFPNAMVDRITPAVGPADAARLNRLTGVEDEVPVFAEDFAQWVLEDRFCSGRPTLETAGVQFTDDVAGYEQVKLRMLNASHSMLAYPGLLGGYGVVHEAMADPRLLGLLRTFLDHDVIPLLTPPAGMSLAGYRDKVLERFSNPAINDQLARIASDGATKIPVFLADTIRACLAGGGDHRRLAFLLAAFTRYLEGAPQEPRLLPADLASVRDADPAAPLRLSAFDGLGLADAAAFVRSYVAFRRRIAAGAGLDIATELGSS